ncbi:MAG: hypothetical protein ACRC2T_02790, partial [Thermoguttaceae bacterium]
MLKPNARIKSGIITFALGISATLACVGGEFQIMKFAQAQPANKSPQVWRGQANTEQYNVPVVSSAVANADLVKINPNPAANVQKDELLLKARLFLAAGDVTSAEKCVTQLEAMNLTYSAKEDQPAYITKLIEQHKNVMSKLRSEGNTEQNRREYADLLTRQSLGLVIKEELDTAEKLARTADAQGVQFNQDIVNKGLDPKSILNRINDKRLAMRPSNLGQGSESQISLATERLVAQAKDILTQGRTALGNGDIEQAEKYCKQAFTFGLTESVFPVGSDTPRRLQSDIAQARLAKAEQIGMDSVYAQSTNNKPTNNSVVQAGSNMPINQSNQIVNAQYNNRVDGNQVRQVSNINESLLDNSMQLEADNHLPFITSDNMTPLGQIEYPVTPENGNGSSSLIDRVQGVNRVGMDISDQVAAEMTRDISAAYRVRESNPEESLNILFQARAKMENTDIDPLQKQNQLKHIDVAIDATKKYIEMNRPRIQIQDANIQVLDE